MTDDRSRDELLAELYEELRRRAANCMRGQPGDHTLQATALVNEVYLKLNRGGSSIWSDRTRFLATASRAMRQVLIDHARRRERQKNKPPGEREPLDRVVVAYEENAIDLLALDAALDRLAERDPQMAEAVELRFFAGLGVDETADYLEIPRRTFERRWKLIRTWLYEELR